MDSEILEKCARLEDFTEALYEAQPKTVRERMQKIIENRTDTKVAQYRKDQNNFGIVFLLVVASAVLWWGLILYLK